VATVRRLLDAGISVVAGTDKAVPGHSLLRELELYVAGGMEPGEVIRIATRLRTLFNHRPFADFTHKAEFDMLGRTYSIGYEPDLEDTLLQKPRQKLLGATSRWAVWYPLQRAKKFQTLPADHQRRILAEHGTLAKRYGTGGHAADVRLACHGLDKNDNDFIVGLLGPELHPLSAIVQEMRKTEQTSQYLDSLGPFFVGKTAWQSTL
jgi:chlorite dismutase